MWQSRYMGDSRKIPRYTAFLRTRSYLKPSINTFRGHLSCKSMLFSPIFGQILKKWLRKRWLLEKNGGNRFLEQIYILFSAKIKLDILDSKMRMVQGIKAFLMRLIQLFIASLFRIYDYLNPIFRLFLDNNFHVDIWNW